VKVADFMQKSCALVYANVDVLKTIEVASFVDKAVYDLGETARLLFFIPAVHKRTRSIVLSWTTHSKKYSETIPACLWASI
jgi:hypothetical protein